jgi:hypothetical protein
MVLCCSIWSIRWTSCPASYSICCSRSVLNMYGWIRSTPWVQECDLSPQAFWWRHWYIFLELEKKKLILKMFSSVLHVQVNIKSAIDFGVHCTCVYSNYCIWSLPMHGKGRWWSEEQFQQKYSWVCIIIIIIKPHTICTRSKGLWNCHIPMKIFAFML